MTSERRNVDTRNEGDDNDVFLTKWPIRRHFCSRPEASRSTSAASSRSHDGNFELRPERGARDRRRQRRRQVDADQDHLGRLLSADGGDLLIDGAPVTIANPREARALGIETVYQDLALADDLDAAANLFLGREELRPPPLSWFGFLDKKAMRRRAEEEMRRLKIGIQSVETAGAEPLGRPAAGGRRRARDRVGHADRDHGRAHRGARRARVGSGARADQGGPGARACRSS